MLWDLHAQVGRDFLQKQGKALLASVNSVCTVKLSTAMQNSCHYFTFSNH
jgi:hypothetical protein